MIIKRNLRIAVSGSLAYDQIMDFPGRFGDHILPDEVHNLNVSFFLKGLKTSFGGTAGNIAYNLSLLGLRPLIFGAVGGDFSDYEKWLIKERINLKHINRVATFKTAAAYIITDQADNQITAFYPGPNPSGYARRAVKKSGRLDLAIIAPDDKGRMLEYIAAYQKNNTPYIFDPGQALIAFTPAELRRALKDAKVLIGNDYEIKLIERNLKINLKALIKMVEILVITKGGHGSEIYSRENKKIDGIGSKKTRVEKKEVGKTEIVFKKIVIKPAKPKNTCDPTGAGDAYRAGFIKGLVSGFNLKTCGQLAATVAVYTVEKFGTQTHGFTLNGLKKRYYENYRERLSIS